MTTSNRKQKAWVSPIRLVWLPVNQAWVFLFGDSVITLDLNDMGSAPRFFERKADALREAKALGVILAD